MSGSDRPRWATLHATLQPVTEWLTVRGIRRVYWALDSTLAAYSSAT